MRRSRQSWGKLAALSALVASCLAAASCSSGGPAVPPPTAAPTQVAACLTFVLESAPPPGLNAYDLQVVDSVKKAVVAELVAAGFAIVESRDKPFDVVLKLIATPASRIETNAQIKGKFSVEGNSGPIDTVEAATPGDAPGAVEAVAAALVDGLFRSANLGGYIKQLRRPGSTGLARTSLRNMAPACEGFVVPATTASAAPASTAAPSASASAGPEAPAAPAIAEGLAGAAQPEAFAMVLGVEHYKSGAEAKGARADAEKVARFVTRTLGVPEANVKTAYDQKADRVAIDLDIEWLKLKVPKGGRVYIYFAGIGTGGKAPGAPAIVPYDGDPKTGARTLQLASLLQSLSETKAADTIVFVDAAFAGTGARSLPAGDAPLASLKGISAAVRTVLVSAVTGPEAAHTSADGSGLFTRYLLQAIGSGRADANADGKVTLHELTSWLGPRVSRAAKRDGKSQTPSLAVGPAVLPADQLALASGLDTP